MLSKYLLQNRFSLKHLPFKLKQHLKLLLLLLLPLLPLLKRLQINAPDIYDQYVTTTSSRRLNFKTTAV